MPEQGVIKYCRSTLPKGVARWNIAGERPTQAGGTMIHFNKRLKRKLIWSIILTILVACEISAPNEQEKSQLERWKVFTSSAYGYSLEYPMDWQAREYLDGLKGNKDIIATIILSTPFTAAITIKRIQIENPEVEDIADWGEELITSRFSSYELQELESIELANGQKALARIYLPGIDKPINSKFIDVYIARESDGLIIRLEAIENKYDSVNEVFEHVINSITFMSPNEA